MIKSFRMVCLLCSMTLLLSLSTVADVNILIIGSTKDSSERLGGNSKPFSPVGVTNELTKILNGCSSLGTVNVALADRYATGTTVLGVTTYAYNLESWFHFPFPKGVESNRWANLRGEAGTNWNYVVLIGDPYTIEYMPGLYALGVADIANEVAKGGAETILLMPWPDSTSSRNIAHYKDVVYRAGRSGEIKVAPGGLAWQAIKGTSLTNPNPNADGTFIAAASIYSTIYKQSAKVSSYVYNDTWADTVNTTEVNNRTAQQYTGNFSFQNPFLFNTDFQRKIYFSSRGTSTESYFKDAAVRALGRCNVGVTAMCPWNRSETDWATNGGDEPWTKWPAGTPTPIAWNDGRDYLTSEWYKSYQINPAYWTFAYSFYYHASTWSYPVADANAHYIGQMFGQDFDMADRMISEGASGRSLPLRTLWAQIHKEFPLLNPQLDGSGPHLSLFESEAVGTYMYALYSSRCPLDPKPVGIDTNWVARRIGYETAWKLGHCQTRAPGFKVMPSSATVLTITPTTKGTNTVQFILPPRSNVTVNVMVDNPKAVIVNPQTLFFTTNNYDIAQTVTFAGLPGAATNDGFKVQFRTVSGDELYSGLYDEWAYTNKRSSVQATVISESGTNTFMCSENTPLTIYPAVTGIASGNTVFAGPVNGSVVVSGTNLVYTPNLGYVGPDSFAYAVNFGGTVTRGYVTITVNLSSLKSVTVISAQGGTSPGSTITNVGATLSFALTNSPLIIGGTNKYTATGATVIGNAYTQANATNITLTLTNSATLTWAWTTNYWLAVAPVGGGSVNVSNAWYGVNSNALITATASNLWAFTGWSGATNGCIIAGNVITAVMSQSRNITANFQTLIPAVSNSGGATNQTATSATLQGLLTAGLSAKAWICWGDSDGGIASTSDWDKVQSIGSVTQGVVFATALTGLTPNKTYFYRCFVTNATDQAWSSTPMIFSAVPVGGGAMAVSSGGSISYGFLNGTNCTIHTFTNNGSLFFTGGGKVEALVVGGGGGGGLFGGGGGAGGYLYTNALTVGIGSYSVTIGNGGSGDTSAGGTGGKGGSTIFGGLTAIGGGGGGSRNSTTPATGVNGASGGSGGGGSASDVSLTTGGAATTGQGNAGGAEAVLGWGGCGGGGAGAVGGSGTGNNAGNGGIGLACSISGTSVYYAGGGGGSTSSNGTGTAGIGGLGGGGAGGKNASGEKGAANTGGGGGAGDANTGQSGGAGGKGIVIVRYLSFDTLVNLAPTAITNGAAGLNAALSAPSTNYAVTVYWGTTDGGTDTGAWANSALVRSWTNVALTNISYQVSGLAAGATYYYAFCATNSGTTVWSQPSWQFKAQGQASANPVIVATAGSGGSISPSESVTVFSGANQTFTITPDTGYHINNVVVDGVSTGAVSSFTFYNVTLGHTIDASFAVNQYTVIFAVGANGTRTGGGALTQQVSYATAATSPTIMPDVDYVFTGWDATFNSVTGDMTITALYALDSNCTLTYLAGPNGSISGMATQTVSTAGDGTPVSAVADPGYKFINWSDSSTGNPRTDMNVLSDITVTANFALNPVIVLNLGAVSSNNTSALLTGELIDGQVGTVWICWGDNDAGMASTSAWDHVVSIGPVSEAAPFSCLVTALSTNTTYFYRCYATGAISSDWSDDATVFNGSPAGTVGNTWTPSQLANAPALWLDADDANTLQLNGGTVTNWIDKSGNGRNATQATSVSQPTDTAGGLNGKHVLTFDGTNDFFRVNLDFLAGVSHSAFIVTKPTIYSNIYGALNANATSNSLHVGFASATNFRMNYWGNDYGPAVTTNFHAGVGNLLNYVWTSGSTKQIFANGILAGSGTGAGVIGPMSGGGQIGRVVSHPYYGGDIAEIIMCTGTLSVADRQMIEGYLVHKWGLAGSLPPSHPYKSSPPMAGSTIANQAPDSITSGSAALNAALDATGTNYNIYVHYGMTDGGTNIASWVSSAYIGSWTNLVTPVSYTADSLMSGQTYYYTFRASNNAGSVWAHPSWSFILSGSMGSNSLVAPTALQASTVSAFQIGLTWSDDNVYETGYLVERSASSGSGFALIGSAVANTTGYTDSTVSAGSTYYYRVSATNSTFSSAPSAEATATTPKIPVTVTLHDLAQTYDGSARTVTATTTPGSLTVTVTYDGSMTAPSNAGSYAVTGTVVNATYQGSTNGTLVVSQATPTVTTWPTAASIILGQALSNATLTGGSASVSGSFSFVSPTNIPPAGVYSAAVLFTPTDSVNYQSVAGSAQVTVIDLYAVPFREPFEERNTGDLNGQYGWVAEGTVVQTNLTFNTSAKAAHLSGSGAYMTRTFTDGRTKAWTDMRIRVVQSPETPVPETNATVAVYVSTNDMVMAFNGQQAVATGLAVQQDTWVRLTMFSDYTAKQYLLYVNDQRAGRYAFYNSAAVTNYTDLRISGAAVFVDDISITPNQPPMKYMPSLILLQ